MEKLISEEKRQLLRLRDRLDEADSKIWFRDERIAELKKKNEILKAHIGELQKVIDRFHDMQTKIELAILNREGNIETGRDLKIVER